MTSRRSLPIAVLPLLLAVPLVAATPGRAAELRSDVTLAPPFVRLDAELGEQVTSTFTLRNEGDGEVEVELASINLDGDPEQGISIGDDEPSGATGWARPSVATLELAPGEEQEFTVVFDVPAAAPDRDHPLGIAATVVTAPSPTEGVTPTMRHVAVVSVELPGGEPALDGTIDVELAGDELTGTTELFNAGTDTLRIDGVALVRPGDPTDALATDDSGERTLLPNGGTMGDPGASFRFPVDELPGPGVYAVSLDVEGDPVEDLPRSAPIVVFPEIFGEVRVLA